MYEPILYVFIFIEGIIIGYLHGNLVTLRRDYNRLLEKLYKMGEQSDENK